MNDIGRKGKGVRGGRGRESGSGRERDRLQKLKWDAGHCVPTILLTMRVIDAPDAILLTMRGVGALGTMLAMIELILGATARGVIAASSS